MASDREQIQREEQNSQAISSKYTAAGLQDGYLT